VIILAEPVCTVLRLTAHNQNMKKWPLRNKYTGMCEALRKEHQWASVKGQLWCGGLKGAESNPAHPIRNIQTKRIFPLWDDGHCGNYEYQNPLAGHFFFFSTCRVL
jgi:hypothetical protein